MTALRLLLLGALCWFVPLPAAASEFTRVGDRDGFLDLVVGRTLTRFGISLSVAPGGAITGRAFGRDVTGSWDWQEGFFCREMVAGSTRLDLNCQAVLVRDDTLRFIADRGRGDTADLRLR